MAYATVSDVQKRLPAPMTEQQRKLCAALLDDVAVLIDAYVDEVDDEVAEIVSCRVVSRAINDATSSGIPVGATQGSMSAMGYSQSWTIGNGATGEIYLTKAEKKMLGVGDQIGSWSPVQEGIS